MKNDQINRQILRELTRDGRISNLELAERVGLSPSACLRRVQELEKAGVITGYRAVLDPAAMGVGFVAYIGVGLGEHTKAAQEGFERALQQAPEVVECHNITGTIEYLLRVECADRMGSTVPGRSISLHREVVRRPGLRIVHDRYQKYGDRAGSADVGWKRVLLSPTATGPRGDTVRAPTQSRLR